MGELLAPRVHLRDRQHCGLRGSVFVFLTVVTKLLVESTILNLTEKVLC